MQTVRATLDFNNVELATKLADGLRGSDHGIELIKRAGAKLTVVGEIDALKGWINCLKMRGMTSGLVHAGLHANLTNATPEPATAAQEA